MSAAAPAAPIRRMSQKSIEFREDIRTAQRSFKILRKLCRQYGMSFQGPGARSEAQKGKSKNAAKAKPKPKPKKNIHSQLFRPEAPSSSESDFSSADDPDGLEHRTQWEDVESILGRLRMDDRVNALEDISESLNKSSQRAQQELLELDLLECGREDPAGGLDGVDESLLTHRPDDMLAVQAVNRCMGLLPELAEWSARKANERMDAQKQVVQNNLEAESREGGASWEEDSDPEGDTELAREIDGRLKKLGAKIPPGADPDLGVVLDAQRREVRRLVQEIKEREQMVEKKRLGMDFLHGKVSEYPQEEDAREAIDDVLRRKRAEVERLQGQAIEKLERERSHVKVPTEAEVEESVSEADQLRSATQRARKKFEAMLCPRAGSASPRVDYPGADGGVSPRMVALRRGAAVSGPPGSPPSPLPILDAAPSSAVGPLPEGDWQQTVSADLMKASKSAAALEEQASQEDQRAARAGELLAGAEGALRTLEETRVVFLSQIAESAPELLDALVPERPESLDGDDSSTEAGSSMRASIAPMTRISGRLTSRGSGRPGEEEEPEEDRSHSHELSQEDPSRRLEALAKEEEWLRAELAPCLADREARPPSHARGRSPSARERPRSKDGATEAAQEAELPFAWKGAAPLADDLEKLVLRVQEASRQARRERPQAVSEEAAALARRKLAVMNHSQLQELLRSRVDGVRLSQEVVRAGAELDLIRANHFPPWPATLLRPRRASAEPGDTMTFQFRRGSARPAELPDPPEADRASADAGLLSATWRSSSPMSFRPGSKEGSRSATASSLRPDSKGAGSEVTARRKSSTHLSEAPPSSGASRPSSQMSPEAAKLFERVQELQRLRSQWWSRRQGPGAVVRRALASEGLVLDPNSSTYFQADKPPAELCEGGFFAQVHSSMTAL